MFFLFLLISFASSNAKNYIDFKQEFDTQGCNPLASLIDLKKHLTDKTIKLSPNQSTELKQTLLNLKKERCSHSGGGFLMLPLVATAWFGIKAFIAYQQLKSTSNIWHSPFVNPSSYANSFLQNLLFGSIAFATTVLCNLEHRENVRSLFRKERELEKQINAVIGMLKTDESTK